MKQILLKRYFGFQGCYEDYFLYTLKVRGWFIFYGNPQLQVPFPIYMNLFRLKAKSPDPIGSGLFFKQYVKIN